MIIGLTGYKGSGKSTVAKYLAEQYGFKRVNFKDALVEEMKKNFRNTLLTMGKLDPERHSDEEIINHLFETKPPIMRALMQNYGTEVRRADNVNYWVDKWKESAGTGNIIADDVRFQNEYDAVKELGGIIIRVVREDITHGGTHQSETEQESFVVDFTIEGVPGSHESIYKQVDSIIQDLKAD